MDLTEKRSEEMVSLNHSILMHITSIPEAFGFFRGQIKYMKDKGFEVQAVSSPGRLLDEVSQRESIRVYALEMPRQITPVTDLISLFKLFRLFRKIKPTIVHAHMPKSGLLGVIAARLAWVPIVIYSMRGLPFVTQTGWRRKLLILTEVIACRGATRVITVSWATKKKAVAQGICLAEKIYVLGNGSSNGVDAEGRFNPISLPVGVRSAVRKDYQISPKAIVIGFIGRLVRDKGIVELAEAWQILRNRYKALFLLLVGPLELRDPIPENVLERLKSDVRVKFTGQVANTVPYYAAMDILTLPTYREGFPNTPLEAAAMGLPVVVTDVDGCPEAVADGVTGIVIPCNNSLALSEALDRLIQDPQKRKIMGKEGRKRVLEKFKPEIVWQALYENYFDLLEKYDK